MSPTLRSRTSTPPSSAQGQTATEDDRQKYDEATQSNRLISVNEMKIRKIIGVLCVNLIALAYTLFPSSRDCYGPLSVALSVSVGVYRTGEQSL